MTASLASRIRVLLFRLGFVYWLLWGVPWVLQHFARLTQTPGLGAKYWTLWNPITRWLGTALLGFPNGPEYTDGGSGDSPFFWTLLIVQLAIAFVTAIAWTLLSSRDRENLRLEAALNLGLRLLLALILLEYGAAKVIRMQFPPPRLEVLATPFGQLTPEALLWAFMGVSPIYSTVAGVVEMSAGALLLFRRTAMLGALLGIFAAGNVLLLNLAYDVPVKLFSVHLIIMGVWIFAPALKSVLLTLAPPVPYPGSSRSRYTPVASLVLLIVVGAVSLRQNAIWRENHGDLAPRPPLYGMYRVTGVSSPDGPLPAGWEHALLIVPRHRGPAQLRLPDGRVVRRRLEVDTSSRQAVLHLPRIMHGDHGDTSPDTLEYREADYGLAVAGRIDDKRVSAQLHLVRVDTLPLLRQQLRWIR